MLLADDCTVRLATDTGGTFTDLIVEAGPSLHLYKAPTDPRNPVVGVLEALRLAAADFGEPLHRFLARGSILVHGTTHAINAVITGHTARTAFLTSRGHREILLLREGGREDPFNNTIGSLQPYVPRALTFEIDGRILADGSEFEAFDERQAQSVLQQLKEQRVEAVAVCLLWSVVNPAHEQRLGELIAEHLPGVPFTLSHELNPTLREYRRASSAAIDASLKPIMSRYLGTLESGLRHAGFAGRLLALTSTGGMVDAVELARSPIRALNSGPSAAPVAGRHYAAALDGVRDVIVADTGGTTFDVTLVRDGHIPLTRETWLGRRFVGHQTGFPSIDVRSIGAGGGSIAWVDEGGLLRIGPDSAGADPGPACFGRGGLRPTVTDAALILGLIDPGRFLAGRMSLDVGLARQSIIGEVARPLGLDLDAAAAAVLDVATEKMVQAILDITVKQGIDPRDAALVGGGGAAGLNMVQIARRLGCRIVMFPSTGSALSAAGALLSSIHGEFSTTCFERSDRFDRVRVRSVLDALEANCLSFVEGVGGGHGSPQIELVVEARYAGQIWELDLPLERTALEVDDAGQQLRSSFDRIHKRVFATEDPDSIVEFVTWRATIRCVSREDGPKARYVPDSGGAPNRSAPMSRTVRFINSARAAVPILHFADLETGRALRGPAIVDLPFTSLVIDPGSAFCLCADGSLLVEPWGGTA